MASVMAIDVHDVRQPKPDGVPVLDLSRFGEENGLNDESLQALRACQELGCFLVINHGISDGLLRNAALVCRDAFKLPPQTKMKNVSSVPYGGYYPPKPQHPFYESFGIARSHHPEAVREFSDLLWPQGNQNFCEIMEEYITKMNSVSKIIHQIFLASWGVSKCYDADFGHGHSFFRMNLYDVSSELASETLGLVGHTDGNSLTLLHEGDDPGGIQVMNKGGDWLDVKSIPNSLVVFAGDSLQVWSNGRIRSVIHRVMVKRRQARLSLALFSHFPEEMEIRTPEELIDDEHPHRYRVFSFGDLVKYRMRGVTLEEHLEHFAGIGYQA